MKKLRIWATIALTLAILGFVILFVMVLALANIYHGEENLTAEWGVLELGFFVIFFFIIATLVFTGLVLRYFRGKDDRKGPGSA